MISESMHVVFVYYPLYLLNSVFPWLISKNLHAQSFMHLLSHSFAFCYTIFPAFILFVCVNVCLCVRVCVCVLQQTIPGDSDA